MKTKELPPPSEEEADEILEYLKDSEPEAYEFILRVLGPTPEKLAKWSDEGH